MRKAIFAFYYAPGTGPGADPRPAQLAEPPPAPEIPAASRPLPAAPPPVTARAPAAEPSPPEALSVETAPTGESALDALTPAALDDARATAREPEPAPPPAEGHGTPAIDAPAPEAAEPASDAEVSSEDRSAPSSPDHEDGRNDPFDDLPFGAGEEEPSGPPEQATKPDAESDPPPSPAEPPVTAAPPPNAAPEAKAVTIDPGLRAATRTVPHSSTAPRPLPDYLTMRQVAAVPHDVLGLFSPEVITVQARTGTSAAVSLGLPSAGMYRPDGFRAAPWSGLAYELAPNDGKGLGTGTRLLTARGEVAVEHLLPSDRVLGLRGPKLARISAITRRALSPGVGADTPIRIPAGAFGVDQPSHDLVVGPEQVVFPDGSEPVSARDLLAPGGPFVPATLPGVELFQVTLSPYPGSEEGDVLLADGVFLASVAGDEVGI